MDLKTNNAVSYDCDVCRCPIPATADHTLEVCEIYQEWKKDYYGIGYGWPDFGDWSYD